MIISFAGRVAWRVLLTVAIVAVLLASAWALEDPIRAIRFAREALR